MDSKTKKSIFAILAVVLTSAVTAPNVVGQDAGTSRASTIEEVIVTATRRATSIEDVPINITAISGDELKALGITDTAELILSTPGATFVDLGPRSGINNATLILRGIGADNTARVVGALQTAQTVSVYVNETPLLAHLRLKDIDRVEVLRGPQGTLYGSGALGGSLRYLYNKPSFEGNTFDIEAGLSQKKSADDPSYEVDGIVNVAFSDQVALRVSTGYVDVAGSVDANGLFQRSANGEPVLANGSSDPIGDAANFRISPPVLRSQEDVDDSEITSVRATLRYQPSEKLDINLSYHYQKTESGHVPAIAAEQFGDALEISDRTLSPSESETDILGLELEYDMGFADFTVSASHYKTEGEAIYNGTGLVENLVFAPFVYGASPRFLSEGLQRFEDEGTIIEARLVSTGDNMLDWAVGVYYQEQKSESTERSFVNGYTDYANACFIDLGFDFSCGFGTQFGNPAYTFPKDVDYTLDQKNDFEDIAIFGEVTWHVTDVWQLTFGGRYFEQDLDHDHESLFPFFNPFIASDPINSTSKENDSIFKVNTSYEITPDLTVYATWSEGFRRGGANGLSALVRAERNTYKPDTVESREIGLKGILMDRFRYTIAYFNMDWDDFQTNTQLGPFAETAVANVGDAESQGVEFEISGNLTDNLSMIAAYSYIDTELSSINPEIVPDLQPLVSYVPGEDLSGAPQNSLFAGLTYEHMLSNGWSTTYSVNTTYRDETESDVTATSARTDDFWLFNSSATLSTDKWSAQAFIKNIADERGIVSSQDSISYGSRRFSVITPPRTFGLRVSYRFDF